MNPKERKILEELYRRKREEPIRFFTPHPKQKEFIASRKKIRCVIGGNRSGKTEMSIIETISYCLGYRPYLDKSHPDYFTPKKTPIRVRLVGEDFGNHLKNVLVPKLKKFCPSVELRGVRKNALGVDNFWEFKNGSTIELMTYEQGAEKFEGWDGDLVVFDEPPPEDIYVACYRGLVDRDGDVVFTLTPLKEPWIKYKIWDKKDLPDSKIDGFIFSIFDNVGFGLNEDAVKDFANQLDEQTKKTRLYGQFLHLAGLVYPEFSMKRHVVKPFEIPKDWPLYVAIDPHPRTPHAVLFMVVSPDGTKFVVDELFKHCLISELCAMMKVKFAELGRLPQITLIDPHTNVPNPVNGVTIMGEFARNGIYCIPASKELSAGINRVKQALKGVGEMPEVFFFSTLRETLNEFGTYVWEEYKGIMKGTKTPKNAPRDKDDHMMENLYRLLIFNPYFSARRQDDAALRPMYTPANTITGY